MNRKSNSHNQSPSKSTELARVIEEQQKLGTEILAHYRLMRSKIEFIETLQNFVKQNTLRVITESQKENMPNRIYDDV
uniref:Uncharacterized protein n=1 Tax=Meloidogyne javanica TaxID=6303 RepID=A0A915MVQ9_MELJA